MVIKTASYKSNQFFTLFIKLSIVFVALYYLYSKLEVYWETLEPGMGNTIKWTTLLSVPNLIILISFSLLNWGLEAFKWKTTVKIIKPLRFKDALEQTLATFTASIFTPNRIGEYAIRPLYFSKADRKKVAFLSLINNSSQMLSTTLFGVIGLFLMIKNNLINNPVKGIYLFGFISLSLGCFLIGYKKKALVYRIEPLRKILIFLKTTHNKTYINISLLSVLRYLVFSHQFYFLLLIFKPELIYATTITAIFSMYLLSSIIPMLSIFDVLVKGSVAVWVLSLIGINEITILTVVMLMWLLNFALPCIVGTYYIFNFKHSQHT